MSTPTIVTNPDRARAILEFMTKFHTANDPDFADLGQTTSYRLEISLPDAMEESDAETACSFLGDAIADWLENCNRAHVAARGTPHPRLLTGESGIEMRVNRKAETNPDEPKWNRFLIFFGNRLAKSLDRNDLDEDMFREMRDLYVAITRTFGPVNARITIGQRRFLARVKDGIPELTEPPRSIDLRKAGQSSRS